MRQIIAPGIEWVSIVLVLFLCLAAAVYGVMSMEIAAYSPTATFVGQAGQQSPGSNRASSHHGSQRSIMPVQPEDSDGAEGFVKILHAQEPWLPAQNTTACHKAYHLMCYRPLRELASRTGGHAPPRI